MPRQPKSIVAATRSQQFFEEKIDFFEGGEPKRKVRKNAQDGFAK
jgi:hypothetical protein